MCQVHGDVTEIREAKDFDNAPEGGCKEICKVLMECGHACESTCHNYTKSSEDPTGHSQTKCVKNCERPRNCGHKCIKKCYMCKYVHEEDCKVKVKKTIEKCGHENTFECSQIRTNPDLKCGFQCEKMLNCGHQCTK